MSPEKRKVYDNIRNPETTEREKLITDDSGVGGGGDESAADSSSDELLQPQSDTQMRNRYLARIGAEVID